MQAAHPARPAHGAHAQKRQPHTGHAAGNLRNRPDQRVPVSQGDGQDTGSGASHCQKHIKSDGSVRNQGGIQKNGARE